MARRAVVFDLDGTLWSSAEWYRSLADAKVTTYPAGLTAARLLKHVGYTEASFTDACRREPPPVFEGVPEAIEQLHATDDLLLGVATNLPGWVARPMLEAADLAQFFDAVAHWERTKRPKPHPDLILAACQRLGIPPGPSNWYVGDTIDDETAATKADLSFALAAWGDDPDASDPDAVLDTPSDLRSLVAP